MPGTGTQVFILDKRGGLLRTVLHLTLGFVAWFVLTIILMEAVEWVAGPVGESLLAAAIVVLFLLSGILVVPLCVLLRWYVATSIAVAVDAETGMTVTRKSMRRAEQTKHYRWQDVTGTEMSTTTSEEGLHTGHTFYVYTADGEQLKIPSSMGSFDYFLDFVNRAATHLPYTWSYFDHTIAGRDRGWHRVPREQR